LSSTTYRGFYPQQAGFPKGFTPTNHARRLLEGCIAEDLAGWLLPIDLTRAE